MFDSLSDWLNQNVSIGNNTNTTLDHQHERILKEMNKEEKRLPVLKKKIKLLEKRLSSIEKKGIDKCSTEELHSRHTLKKSIQKYQNIIELIKSGEMKSKYLLEVSEVLFEYYTDSNDYKYTDVKSDIPDEKDVVVNEQNKIQYDENTTKTTNMNTICESEISFTNNGSYDQEEEMYPDLFEKSEKIEEKYSTPNKLVSGIEAYITSTVRSDKSNVLNQYMSIVNDKYHGDLYIHNKNQCPDCKQEYDMNIIEGTATCPNCARTEIRLIESTKPNFKEPIQNNSYFCYKRINHFNENLNQIQAKESTDIPEVIMDLIRNEIKKSRIKDLSTLTVPKMKAILKKLTLNKYYEHVPHIINKLNGLPPPKLSSDIEDKLRRMFKEIQAPFEKVCPNNRKNFLNYSYVLHKMVQLLSLDEFLVCFPLLKSRDKLHAQDQVWKAICKELRWEFIPSC